MTTTAYTIWFVLTAVMTMSVLAIGTLAAAELLPRRRRDPVREEPEHEDRTPWAA